MFVRRPERRDVDDAVTAMWIRDVKRTARSGDWLLTRSYSMTADFITLTTGGQDVSHASIYDAERGTVIEALEPAVREVPLENLIRRNHRIIVVRPSGLSDRERLASVARARSVVGAEFDFWGMLGAGSDERFYCSELVVWASQVRFETGAVVTPGELADHGVVVYASGSRDDPSVASAALERVPELRSGSGVESRGLKVEGVAVGDLRPSTFDLRRTVSRSAASRSVPSTSSGRP